MSVRTSPDTWGDGELNGRSHLRLTYVVHHYPPTYRAGAELYTQRVARWMHAQGHDVEVVAIESIDAVRDGDSTRVETTIDDDQGVVVHRLRFKLVGAPNELTWRFDNPLLEEWFDDYIAARRPDFVHFMAGYLVGVGPLRAVHNARVSMALTLHDYWFVCPRHTLLRGDGSLCTEVPASPAACARCIAQASGRTAFVDKLSGGLYSAALERFGLAAESEAIARRRSAAAEAITWPDVVIAPTHFLGNKIRASLPQATLRYLPIGFDEQPPVAAAPHTGGPVQIAFMGQIAHHKGVHVLVKAVRALDPTALTLHIYGVLETNPKYVAQLRTLAGDAPNIHFHGGYDHTQLAHILNGLDAVVAPSIWYENSPLVIIEALAAGVPVLTSNLGGMAELVADGRTGLLFAVGNADALAAQLRTFVADAALRARLRAGALANGRRSVTDEMNELERLYLATLAERTAAHTPGAYSSEVSDAHRN